MRCCSTWRIRCRRRRRRRRARACRKRRGAWPRCGATVMVRVNSSPDLLSDDLKAAAQSPRRRDFPAQGGKPGARSGGRIPAGRKRGEAGGDARIARRGPRRGRDLARGHAARRPRVRQRGLLRRCSAFPRARRRSTGRRRWSRRRRARAAWPRSGCPDRWPRSPTWTRYDAPAARARSRWASPATPASTRSRWPVSNRVYSPTAEEIALAAEIVAAFEAALTRRPRRVRAARQHDRCAGGGPGARHARARVR